MTVVINGTTGYSGPVGTIGDLTTTGNTTLGDASGDTLTINGSTTTLTQGTANGVAYLNGSKALTTGSALTFDGTNLSLTNGAIRLSNGYEIGWGANSSYIVGNSSSNVLQFITNSSEQMRLTSTGLGIGTSSPAYKLDTYSTDAAFAAKIKNVNGTDAGGGLWIDTRWNTPDNRPLKITTNSEGYSLLELTGAGNLGIGTSSPSTPLHIYSVAQEQIRLGRNTTGSSGYITFYANNSSSAQVQYAGILGDVASSTAGSHGGALLFYTTGSGTSAERARINASGQLLVGATTDYNFGGKILTRGGGVVSSSSTWDNSSTGGAISMFCDNANYGTIWALKNGNTAWGDVAIAPLGGNLLVGTTNGIGKLAVATASGTGSTSSWDNGYLTVAPGGTSTSTGIALSVNTANETTQISSLTPGIAWRDLIYKAEKHIWHYGGNTEAARINSSGNLIMANRTDSTVGQIQAGRTANTGGMNGYISVAADSTNPFPIAIRGESTNQGFVGFFDSTNTEVGRIGKSGSNTTYVTSSDYRLKHDIQPMVNALAKVAALKPCTYKWNADGSDGQGFIAHELAEVCHDAVHGEKDAVDEKGNPKYQGIDTSFLVATLTAAIQEQQAIIETLKARLDAANL